MFQPDQPITNLILCPPHKLTPEANQSQTLFQWGRKRAAAKHVHHARTPVTHTLTAWRSKNGREMMKKTRQVQTPQVLCQKIIPSPLFGDNSGLSYDKDENAGWRWICRSFCLPLFWYLNVKTKRFLIYNTDNTLSNTVIYTVYVGLLHCFAHFLPELLIKQNTV